MIDPVRVRQQIAEAERRMEDMAPQTRKRYREALDTLTESVEAYSRGDVLSAGLLFARALPVMVDCERRRIRRERLVEKIHDMRAERFDDDER